MAYTTIRAPNAPISSTSITLLANMPVDNEINGKLALITGASGG